MVTIIATVEVVITNQLLVHIIPTTLQEIQEVVPLIGGEIKEDRFPNTASVCPLIICHLLSSLVTCPAHQEEYKDPKSVVLHI